MKVLRVIGAADSIGLVSVELMRQLNAIAVPKGKGTVPFRRIAGWMEDGPGGRSLVSLIDKRDYGESVSERARKIFFANPIRRWFFWTRKTGSGSVLG
jgi:hypothetical protein